MNNRPEQEQDERRKAPLGRPPAPSESAKRPYSTPRLVDYGDLREITKAKDGRKGDGGNPKTRL
jgi:hypothetical protein